MEKLIAEQPNDAVAKKLQTEADQMEKKWFINGIARADAANLADKLQTLSVAEDQIEEELHHVSEDQIVEKLHHVTAEQIVEERSAKADGQLAEKWAKAA